MLLNPYYLNNYLFMNFSLKQYAAIFTLVSILLALLLTYQVSSNIKQTREAIDRTNQESAKSELEHSIELTLENIELSTIKITQWQEVQQQINNPEIFAYWYNVRLKQTALELQDHTIDLMIYDKSGTALAKLNDNTLPFKINTKNSSNIYYLIDTENTVICTLPIYESGSNEVIIGYLSTRIDFLSILKSLNPFQYIKPNSLRLIPKTTEITQHNLTISDFIYELNKPQGINLIEEQIKKSIITLVVILIIPIILLYLALVFIIGIPVNELIKYINQLHINPETINLTNQQSRFRLKELNSVYDSLIEYHNNLIQQENHLSLTLNSISEAVLTTDSDNNIVRMNPIAEKLTGYSLPESIHIPSTQIFNIVDAYTRLPVTSPFETVRNTARTIHSERDVVLISKNNSECIITFTASPIRDSNNMMIGSVLIFSDVTEQRIKDDKLQHSTKMDALGKLTGGIAHDFNNLLGIILGYSELLISHHKPLADKSYEYADAIYKAGQRGHRLTSQLLAFSRKHSAEADIFDINKLIKSEIHILEKTLTARIDLSLELSPEIWPTYIDDNLFQDAILNICINAMHAMPDGGILKIISSNTHINASNLKYSNLKNGDYVKISFIDNGTGMDEDTRKKIFDPFFSTKGEQGTGLGMSQVYGFIQQSSGHIIVDSKPDMGTTIEIYLPRYINSPDATTRTETSDVKENRITGNETILVVDDEPAMLSLTSGILEQNGYNILRASSAEEALQILLKNKIDLLLTDVIMPDIDGFELSSIVADKYPDVTIQLVSGYSETKNLSEQHQKLNDSKIQKPFRSAELLSRIRKALDD